MAPLNDVLWTEERIARVRAYLERKPQVLEVVAHHVSETGPRLIVQWLEVREGNGASYPSENSATIVAVEGHFLFTRGAVEGIANA